MSDPLYSSGLAPPWVGFSPTHFCHCPHPEGRHAIAKDGLPICLVGLCPCRGRATEEKTGEGRVNLWESGAKPWIEWEPRQTKRR